MRIIFYTILIFSLSFGWSQVDAQDVFFLDMGIAIEPQKGLSTTDRSIKQNKINYSKNIITNKQNERSVYMATTSEVFSSIDKINGQVNEIEKAFAAQLLALEIENSRLRDQVNSLNQKINAEIINWDNEKIEESKPSYISTDPIESSVVATEMIDADLSLDISENFISSNVGFDEGLYNKGMLAYNNGEYDKCIKYLKPLSLDSISQRTSSNILLLLSESYEKIGRYKQALNSLNKLFDLKIDKYSDLVLIKKAIIYRNIGMDNEAQEIFQIILSDYPDSKYIGLAEDEIKNI